MSIKEAFMQSQIDTFFKAFPVPGYVAADHPQNNSRHSLSKLNTNTQNIRLSKKQRQKTPSNRTLIIEKYKRDVKSVWINDEQFAQPWFNPKGFTLNCKRINDGNLPIGFTKVTTNKAIPRYQYNFTDPLKASSNRNRPTAYRIPFLLKDFFYDQKFTVSHLCHNNWCYNWDHHTFEPLEHNKGRNGCPGGDHCHHVVSCLIPGPYFAV